MTEKINRQYGLWDSPLSPAALAGDRRLDAVACDSDGGTLVWLEGRSGRGVLVAQSDAGDAPRDLTSDLSVRAEVGYGGGDFTSTISTALDESGQPVSLAGSADGGRAAVLDQDRINLMQWTLAQQKIDAAIAERELASARDQLVVVQPGPLPNRVDGVNTGSPSVTPLLLGGGGSAVGVPAFDVVNRVIYVGTDAGVIYAIEYPFP